MAKYHVELNYKIQEFVDWTGEAADVEEADELAREFIQESIVDAVDIEIDSIREVNA